MAERRQVTVDGNEAAASVAYRLAEVIAIYPITPSSTMAELSDEWSVAGRTNIWGQIPEVIEMQSEAGAAGAIHGALQAGALATTFTSSQGLLLFIPDMFRIAGEFLPCCIHVSARAIATHALSIFGDHQDVMACRQTGFALLASSSVQEAHDLAAVAHAATLESRVPFLHFMDGFRTSHEVNTIKQLSDDDLHALIDESWIEAHRARALSPEHPVARGTAANPDTYFQGRERGNPFYLALPDLVEANMERFASVTGRRYGLFDYAGHPEAERVLVLMGSGADVAQETVEWLVARGEKVGVVKVHLFRPFSVKHFLRALPPTTKGLAVLDRTKEPGSLGEPLYLEVLAALATAEAQGKAEQGAGASPLADTPAGTRPIVIGGRYGLGSKEFDPAMVNAVLNELAKPAPRRSFTVGIHDDLTGLSLEVDRSFHIEPEDVTRAVLFGLGADGTVGASKNTVKILGEEAGRYAQGYFVYDSKKSGSLTVSHLRFGPRPIRSSYLIRQADFVACHQYRLFDRVDILSYAAPGGTVLLNTPYPPEQVWDSLSRSVQQEILDKQLDLWVIDAFAVAEELKLGFRINVIMQTCFFAISGVLPRDEAIEKIKQSIEKTYGKKGGTVVQRNIEAVERTLAGLHHLEVPRVLTAREETRRTFDFSDAPEIIREVVGPMITGHGDEIPVSKHPADGTWPLGTTKYEKRSLALEIPIWEPALCIQCGKCSFSCPHSTIRTKMYEPAALEGAPATFRSAEGRGARYAGQRYTVQVAPDDCTGCRLCVATCPGKDRSNPSRRAINMRPHSEHVEAERDNYRFFLTIPSPSMADLEAGGLPIDVKTSQFVQPLFEYSGACAGCGETQYPRLLSQLFGDRVLIANATGCSSIYSGNLPSIAYTVNREGRGPAWANSLFEDNAEFGLGFRLAVDQQTEIARAALCELAGEAVPAELAAQILDADQSSEAGIAAQRERVLALRRVLASSDRPAARRLESVADFLVHRSVWIIGGDGWAYDIGFGGLDHVLATGRDVRLLVLDTQIYSNTGGQKSKATPMGAVAKFAAAGKTQAKKDLGLMAMTYGHVYVAQVAWGARDSQTVQALLEAESYRGPSLVIGYAHCVGHGYDLAYGRDQQRLAVESGQWLLYRFDPRRLEQGLNPLQLDSPEPSISFHEYAEKEIRFRMLERLDPLRARELFIVADASGRRRCRLYKQLSELDLDGTAAEERRMRHDAFEHYHMPSDIAEQASTRAAGTPQATGDTPETRDAALSRVAQEARAETTGVD